MPLSTSKIRHIQANLKRVMAGRTQSVILTLALPGGGTTTLTVPAVWRPVEDQDPDYDPGGMGGASGNDLAEADVVAMFNIADVSYAQMRSCVYVQLAAGQPGPAFATRYIPTAIFVKGMVPGGDRLIVSFDRQR
jgi:hypothetical protein